jgi:hypothetical protein
MSSSATSYRTGAVLIVVTVADRNYQAKTRVMRGKRRKTVWVKSQSLATVLQVQVPRSTLRSRRVSYYQKLGALRLTQPLRLLGSSLY